jgi:3-oxoacyl-[acyl-carrier protein] reductase
VPGILASKVAIVTGGGWNIGRATALAFAEQGARVVVASRREERLAEVAEEIRARGGEALALACDVTSWEQVRALAERTLEQLGTIDVLAALAGGGGAGEPIEEFDPARWDEIVRVNLTGTFHAVRAVLPTMKAKGAGTIVTCGGGGSQFPLLGVHATAYASAKAALCRFTDQLAVELLESGVRVNCLLPGHTPSPDALRRIEEQERASGAAHPERAHMRSPEEAAELAAWLASDSSAPLSGRLVSPQDGWWRDAAKVDLVQQSLHAYCLRRQEMG